EAGKDRARELDWRNARAHRAAARRSWERWWLHPRLPPILALRRGRANAARGELHSNLRAVTGGVAELDALGERLNHVQPDSHGTALGRADSRLDSAR